MSVSISHKPPFLVLFSSCSRTSTPFCNRDVYFIIEPFCVFFPSHLQKGVKLNVTIFEPVQVVRLHRNSVVLVRVLSNYNAFLRSFSRPPSPPLPPLGLGVFGVRMAPSRLQLSNSLPEPPGGYSTYIWVVGCRPNHETLTLFMIKSS